jgi:hypothetical protein
MKNKRLPFVDYRGHETLLMQKEPESSKIGFGSRGMKNYDQKWRSAAARTALLATAFALVIAGTAAYAADRRQQPDVTYKAYENVASKENLARYKVYEGLPLGSHRRVDLGLEETNGGPIHGYAFIKQILERPEPYLAPEPPRVVVYLRPEPSYVPPEEWSWEVYNPSDTQLAYDLTVRWYGQASCPDDLTNLMINGPGGLATQSPLSNPIYGYFNYQSASVDRVKEICVQWAENNNCDPIETDCQKQETFNLFSDVTPEGSDFIVLSGSCSEVPLTTSSPYLPEIELRCDRSP